jgi:hypothetical protein
LKAKFEARGAELEFIRKELVKNVACQRVS